MSITPALLRRLALLLAAAMLALAPATARAEPLATAISDGCIEASMFVAAPEELVAPFVSDGYEPAHNPLTGASQRSQQESDLIIRAIRCDRQEVAGHVARDTTLVQFGAVVEPPRPTAPALFDVYTFYWASDNRRLVDWFRQERGAQEFKYSRDLALTSMRLPWTNPLALPLHASALSVTDPELSAFTLGFSAYEPVVEVPIRVNWWADVRSGRMLVSNTIPIFLTGSTVPENQRFTFEPGTDLAQMLRDGHGPPSFVFARFNGQVTTREVVQP